MVDNRYGTIEEKRSIATRLSEWGILTDIDSGCISYEDISFPRVKCKSLYLMRHAETEAVKMRQFMSDTSENSRLTLEGIDVAINSLNLVESRQFDLVLYGPVKRVIDTKNVIESLLTNTDFVLCEKLKGIDNSGWEGKNIEELKNDAVFIDREIKHNVFAKTELGSSWGEVLCNCVEVLEYINLHCRNLGVLLVSQGSILRGIEILLHKRDHPWDDYVATVMYNLKNSHTVSNYGTITRII